MTNAFRRVRPGEPVKIAATAWNQVIDQVRVRPQFDAEASGHPPTTFQVRIRNSTSGAIERWGVLHITGVLETPTGATGLSSTDAGTTSFQQWPGLVGVTPTGTTQGSFAVAVEPIQAGQIGMAAVDGVVQCKLDITSEDDRFAKPKPGSSDELQTASSGEAAILWKESGTGTGKWGLVRIGAGAGGGVKVGKITGTWTKGGTQTVWEHTGAGEQVSGPSGPVSITGVNRFASVSATGSAAKWVAVANVDSHWHLIAAECSDDPPA
jgi:hypothetical protein